MRVINAYQVLGVERTADAVTIKRAFHALAKLHHPDVGGDAERYKAVTQAYALLNDPSAKAYLDAVLRQQDAVRSPVEDILRRAAATSAETAAAVSQMNRRAQTVRIWINGVHVGTTSTTTGTTWNTGNP